MGLDINGTHLVIRTREDTLYAHGLRGTVLVYMLLADEHKY